MKLFKAIVTSICSLATLVIFLLLIRLPEMGIQPEEYHDVRLRLGLAGFTIAFVMLSIHLEE